MLLARSVIALSFLLGACDIAPDPVVADDPFAPPAPYDPLYEVPGATYRYGIVEWEALDTDCPPDGAWVEDEVGMAILDGDQLTLVLETTPELNGTVSAGAAHMNGRVEFEGETGAIVDCVVAGSAALTVAEVSGALTERMSSFGDLNCSANARFRLRFD